jgi:hypothetical protein
MNDIESDYMDYETAKNSEGGLHSGRRPPYRRLLVSVAIALGLLVAALVALALVPGR